MLCQVAVKSLQHVPFLFSTCAHVARPVQRKRWCSCSLLLHESIVGADWELIGGCCGEVFERSVSGAGAEELVLCGNSPLGPISERWCTFYCLVMHLVWCLLMTLALSLLML